MDEKTDDFLAHYGVKGMRWGTSMKINLPASAAASGGAGGGSSEDEELTLEDLTPAERMQFNKAMATGKGTTVSAFLRNIKAQRQIKASKKNAVDRSYVNGQRVVSTANTSVVNAGNKTITTDKLPNYTRTTTTTDVGKETLDKAASWMKRLFHGEELEEDALAHFGVRGMKWGVRRSGKSGTSQGGGDAGRSEDSAKAKAALGKVKGGGVKALSNAELQDLNTRLSLEQNFSKLTAKPQGKSFVQKALAAGKVTNEIIKFMDSPAAQALKGGIGNNGPGSSSASRAAKKAAKKKGSNSFAEDAAKAWAASRAKASKPDGPIDLGTVKQILVPEDHWLPRGST